MSVANVTFAPACRNDWHIHRRGGQILLVTRWRGYYRARGEPARELRPGDVVNIPPDVKHWHGAAPDSWFSHLAVEVVKKKQMNLFSYKHFKSFRTVIRLQYTICLLYTSRCV